MRHPSPPQPGRPGPRGNIMVQFAILLPVLLGMTGLVIDCGLMMASHRQVQNAADAAALAAAMELYRGNTDYTTAATAFLSPNGLTNSPTMVLHNPPAQGPYSTIPTKNQYVEAIVTYPINLMLIPALNAIPGINLSRTTQVQARAVAGFERVSSGEGVIVLDPTATPGLSVSGNNTRLVVDGTIVDNSQGSGYNQFGDTITTTYSKPAVTTINGNPTPAPIVCRDLQVVGGVDALTTIDNIRAYDRAFATNGYYYDPSNQDRPLFAGAPSQPDPLQSVPAPSSSNGVVTGTSDPKNPYWGYSNGAWVTSKSPQDINIVNSDDLTNIPFKPGMYKSISINGGVAKFTPGIYVVGVNGNGGGDALTINGGVINVDPQQNQGINGVMFYNTGSDYTISNPPDSNDGATLGNTNAKFGDIKITGGTGTLTPYTNVNDANDPFNGILLYQRRWNTKSANIAGGSTLNMAGTIYGKWALFQLSGGGTFNAQFVVGSMSVSGGATLTINAAGKNFGRANQVFLVD